MSSHNNGNPMTRRHALRRIAILGATAAAPTLLADESAFAASSKKCHGTTPKSAVQYRNKPKGSHQCSNCTHFCPGSSAKAEGTCNVVKGSISPHGWCLAWAAKS